MVKYHLKCYIVQSLYNNGLVFHARQVKPAEQDLRGLSASFQLAPEVGVLLGRGQILLPALPWHTAGPCLRGLKFAARQTGLLTYW